MGLPNFPRPRQPQPIVVMEIPPELMTEEELSQEIDKLNCKPTPPDNILVGRRVSRGTPVRK